MHLRHIPHIADSLELAVDHNSYYNTYCRHHNHIHQLLYSRLKVMQSLLLLLVAEAGCSYYIDYYTFLIYIKK